MARPRTIKPEYFEDRVIGKLGSQVGTVYQALWCLADDGGVARADPDLVHGAMFTRWPEYTVTVITDCMQRLAGKKRIRLYEIEGEVYAEIPALSEHSPGRSRFRHPRGGRPIVDLKAFLAKQLGLTGYDAVPIGTDRSASASPITDSLSPSPVPDPTPVPVPPDAAAAARGTTGVPSPAYGVPTLSYLQRCVVALNTAVQAHPGMSCAVPIPASSQEDLVTWERDGIPIALVERVIAERVRAYRPAGRNTYPRSLKYFDAAVRDAWEREAQQAGARGGLVDRGDGVMMVQT